MGLTKCGKGMKLEIVVDASGLPLGAVAAAANVSEYELAMPALDDVPVSIPEGTPVSLLANVDGEADPADLLALCVKVKLALAKIKLQNLDAAATKELLRTEVAPALWQVSKCPDFALSLKVVDERTLVGTTGDGREVRLTREPMKGKQTR